MFFTLVKENKFIKHKLQLTCYQKKKEKRKNIYIIDISFN